jgi:hypothetical protein
MRTIFITILVAGVFVLYLFQHRCSVESTQKITQLEKEIQLLQEEVINLQSQCARIFLYTNLEQTAQDLNLIFLIKSTKDKSDRVSTHTSIQTQNRLITNKIVTRN